MDFLIWLVGRDDPAPTSLAWKKNTPWVCIQTQGDYHALERT